MGEAKKYALKAMAHSSGCALKGEYSAILELEGGRIVWKSRKKFHSVEEAVAYAESQRSKQQKAVLMSQARWIESWKRIRKGE
jgi:hypothetical protein